MSYLLRKISFGTSIVTNIATIKTDHDITGMYYCKNIGFILLFKKNHFLGMVKNNGDTFLPWLGFIDNAGSRDGTLPLLDSPSSLCFDNNRCYLIEKGGTRIRTIQMDSGYVQSVLNNICIYRVGHYFSKTSYLEECNTSCIYYDRHIYWIVDKLNRCLRLNKNYYNIDNYVGSGRSGYITSIDLNQCRFSSPSSMVNIKNDIYIADSGNSCIRKIHDGKIFVVGGIPLSKGDVDGSVGVSILTSPSQMTVGGKIIYFVDNNKIKYFTPNKNTIGTIRKVADNAIISCDISGNLYILEKI